MRTILPVLAETFGPDDARYLGSTAARLIGMQYATELARGLGVSAPAAEGVAEIMRRAAEAQDDRVEWSCEGGEVVVR